MAGVMRITNHQAEISGAKDKNPGRFKGRKTAKRKRPLGDPYVGMTPEQKVCWFDCVYDMPWLHSGHRQILRLTCVWLAKLEMQPDFGVQPTKTLSSLLSKLGATPIDETRVSHADDEDDTDDEKFFPAAQSH